MYRIAHMVENARANNQIIAFRITLQPFLKVSKHELRSVQSQQLPYNQAAHERKLIGFDGVDDRRAMLVKHIGMRTFQGAELQHATPGNCPKLLDTPVDPSIRKHRNVRAGYRSRESRERVVPAGY